MPIKPQILICTVGTSLIEGNLLKLKESDNAELYRLTQKQEWAQIARVLARLSPAKYICGAEINSNYSLQQNNYVDIKTIYFCISDTERGKQTAQILKSYYEKQQIEVNICEIQSLRDDTPEVFRTIGLRNLAREIGKIVRGYSNPKECAINATGGYKAQIAIAVLIGQALGVPVFYKHECFDKIISFPPMAITFDYDLIEKYSHILLELEKNDMEYADIPEEIELFTEQITIDNQRLCSLSPIGQIFLEHYRQKFPESLIPPSPAEESKRKKPTLSQHGYGGYHKEFLAWATKLWKDCPFITTVKDEQYNNQCSIRETRFYLDNNEDIIGEKRFGKIGLRLKIYTTATNKAQKNAIVFYLNEHHSK